MITVTNAQIYSIENGNAVAYEITYSDGQVVRTVVANDDWLRLEYKTNCGWKISRGYIVKKDNRRQGERMIETVKNFLEI